MLKAMLCLLPPMFKPVLQVAEFWFEYSWRGSHGTLFIAWGREGGRTRCNLADPPFGCYFTEVIPPNNIWWLSRPPTPPHVFIFQANLSDPPSESFQSLQWSPFWILSYDWSRQKIPPPPPLLSKKKGRKKRKRNPPKRNQLTIPNCTKYLISNFIEYLHTNWNLTCMCRKCTNFHVFP